MISATGVRVAWAQLPASVRDAVEDIIGARVRKAWSQTGGFSPGSADRVLTYDGRRAFVKAAGLTVNEMAVELHRREALVSAALPPEVPSPTLLGVHDDGEWVALVFEDVAGRTPRTPWVGEEINAVFEALAGLASAAIPAELLRTLPDAAEKLANDMAGWQRIALEPPAALDPWARAHLDQLSGVADRAAAAFAGDQLVHTDIRADNLLLRPDGSVVIVDWPWATRGPAWLDRLLLLVNIALFGGHDVEQILAVHIHAEPDDVTAALAGFAGFFLDAARRPAPPGLPTVRGFQAAQGASTLEWLKRRWKRR
jgi:Ser/Thr protein kinase RdoA (MazF antagonist)